MRFSGITNLLFKNHKPMLCAKIMTTIASIICIVNAEEKTLFSFSILFFPNSNVKNLFRQLRNLKDFM